MLFTSKVFLPDNQLYNITHQGSWQVPFPKHATQKDVPFFTLDGEEKKVQMMGLRAHLQFAQFDDLEGDLVGVPHTWYLSAQSFIRLLKLV